MPTNCYLPCNTIVEYIALLDVHSTDGDSIDSVKVALELAWWARAMCNGRRNQFDPHEQVPKASRVQQTNAFPPVREEGDGFYIAVFSTHPDVLFAVRSVFMQLVSAISKRKRTLAKRLAGDTPLSSGMAVVPARKTGSLSELEMERAAIGNISLYSCYLILLIFTP